MGNPFVIIGIALLALLFIYIAVRLSGIAWFVSMREILNSGGSKRCVKK